MWTGKRQKHHLPCQRQCETAITMILANCDLAEATRRLEQARGHIRQAIM